MWLWPLKMPTQNFLMFFVLLMLMLKIVLTTKYGQVGCPWMDLAGGKIKRRVFLGLPILQAKSVPDLWRGQSGWSSLFIPYCTTLERREIHKPLKYLQLLWDQQWLILSIRYIARSPLKREYCRRNSHTSYLSWTPRIYSCKFFLAGVNFYRFNAKNWRFLQI